MSAKSKNSKPGGKPEKLHVGLLLDESGSMLGNENAVIGGVNEFVERLRAQESSTKVSATLGTFDRRGNEPVVRYVYSGIPLDEVIAMTPEQYLPHGATPLNDAVAGVIRQIDSQASKGERVMLVVLTDGLENASETPTRQLRKLISEKEAAGWEFIYLGANQDAWAESDAIGIDARGKKFDYIASHHGTEAALRFASDRALRFRESPVDYDKELPALGDAIAESGEVERKRDDD
ncbi:hypothetical protein BH10ACT11_BH10ACT11_15940 [soil metagenome]